VHQLWANNNLGLQINMVVLRRYLHQTTKQVHDYHDEHSLPRVGLMCVVFLDEWLKMRLGLSTQLVRLNFNVAHWRPPFVLHVCLVHS
jgi:hypothetical protein